MTHVATLECSLCSALLLVYPQDQPADSALGWNTPDAETCKAPPIDRCPHALAEAKKRFPELYR